MSKIIDFFSWIFKGIVTALSFMVSAPGLLLTSIGSLLTSVYSIIGQLTDKGTVLASLSNNYAGPLTEVCNMLRDMSDIFKWITYLLSLDVLFEGLYTIISIIIPLTLVLATFFFITLPLFLFQFYMLKFTVWLVTSVFPPQYLPSILNAVGSNMPLSVGTSVVNSSDGVNFGSSDLNI